MKHLLTSAILALALTGCATSGSSDVAYDPYPQQPPPQPAPVPQPPPQAYYPQPQPYPYPAPPPVAPAPYPAPQPAPWRPGPPSRRPPAEVYRRFGFIVEQGKDRIAYRVQREGVITIIDDEADRIIISSYVKPNDVVEVRPHTDRIMVNGKAIYQRNLEKNHRHLIFFREDHDDRHGGGGGGGGGRDRDDRRPPPRGPRL